VLCGVSRRLLVGKAEMRICQHFRACITLALLVAAAGCRNPDPLGVMRDTPSSPSSFYRGAGDSPPFVVPRHVPDLEAGPLSLAQCIQIALENNPEARISWQTARSAAAAVGQARGALLPQIDFSASRQRSKSQVLTEIDAVFIRTMYDATFGVRQLLFDFGARRAKVDSAEAALRTADFRHNSLLLDLALATELSYYELLAAQSLQKVAEDTVIQRTRHLELAQRRLNAGLGRKVDVLQAAAERAGAELGLVEARSKTRVARGRLATVMGLRASTPIEVVEIPDAVRELERRDVDSLMEQAAWRRPQLKAAASDVMRLRRELDAQRAGRWPELSASASIGLRDTHFLPDEHSDERAVAISLRWPLFTGFQRTYSIRQLEAELTAAIDSYEKTLRDVELEVWTAYSELIRAEEALAAAEAFVSSARENLNVAERGYQEGRANIVELIDAQTNLTVALARQVGVRLDWYSSMARLERAIGESFQERTDKPAGDAPPPAQPTVPAADGAQPAQEGAAE
jgi:outer membrane protein